MQNTSNRSLALRAYRLIWSRDPANLESSLYFQKKKKRKKETKKEKQSTQSRSAITETLFIPDIITNRI